MLKAQRAEREGSVAPVAPVPPKSKMTSKDPVASVLRSQAELAKFNKQKNARVTELAAAGKIKGVDPGAVQRIQLKRLEDRLDDAVTIKEQERISTAIRELTKRMDSGEKTRTASGVPSVDLNPKEVFDPLSSRVKALKINRDEEIRRPNGSLIGDSPRNARIKVIQELYERLPKSRSERETNFLKESIEKALSALEVIEPFNSRVKALKINRDEDIRRPNGLLIAESPRNARIKVIQDLYERLPNSRSEEETKFLKESLEKALSSLEGE